VRADKTVVVEIPAGVSSNNYLTLRGQGAAGPRNGPPGDLLVMLDIREDDRFERQGDDLIFDLPLSFSQVALGLEVTVPTPYGDEQIKIAPGTQPETIVRLRNRGLPVLGQNSKGDLIVRVHVWTPERLSAEQERLFRELAALEGEPPKRSPGFWSKLKEALGA
jgi:molecular chaperone DnaJ